MQIFKFGGASVKDAEGVKNLAHVSINSWLQQYTHCGFSYGKNNQCDGNGDCKLL